MDEHSTQKKIVKLEYRLVIYEIEVSLGKKTDIKQSKWDVSNMHYVKTNIKIWKTNLHILIRSIKVMANKRNLKRLTEKKKILVEIKQWQIPLYLKFGSKEYIQSLADGSLQNCAGIAKT